MVEQPPEQSRQQITLSGVEGAQEIAESVVMTGDGCVHACPPDAGERGEGPAAVLGADLAPDETRVAEPVDGPRQSTRREPRLDGQFAHPQPAVIAPGEMDEYVEALGWQPVVTLDRGHARPPEPRGSLEHEAGEGDWVTARSSHPCRADRVRSRRLAIRGHPPDGSREDSCAGKLRTSPLHVTVPTGTLRTHGT